MQSETRCPKDWANICHDHCYDRRKGKPCEYWESSAAGQYCDYWNKLREKQKREQKLKEKLKKAQKKKAQHFPAGPSHR